MLALAVGDINGDGKPDLVTNIVSVLLDKTAMDATAPTFAANINFPIPYGAVSVATGDVNGDGKLDVIVANQATHANSVSIVLNTTANGATAPNFAAHVEFATGCLRRPSRSRTSMATESPTLQLQTTRTIPSRCCCPHDYGVAGGRSIRSNGRSSASDVTPSLRIAVARAAPTLASESPSSYAISLSE
jgi:hypothetical protein